MNRLLRADFRKFLKDKLFLVLIILAVVFALVTPLLYVAVFSAAGEMDPMSEEMLAGYVSAKGQFFGAFSFGNNLGLIAPLLVGVVLYKDFGSGTVRNKVISGHSRRSIFMSMYGVLDDAVRDRLGTCIADTGGQLAVFCVSEHAVRDGGFLVFAVVASV